MGGARDPRHEFGGRRGGEVWRGGARDRDDGEIGARALDRPVATAFFRTGDGEQRATQIQWPWFILFFCLAAIANTYLMPGSAIYSWLYYLARVGLTATLFLIGSGITVATLRRVGARPLIQGILLWVIVAATSLALIRAGWISI
jgi:hypothetical protein